MRDKQYKGNLTPKQAAEGIRVAIENAASLVTDAKLLFDNGRYERSVALAVLAIEEAGKISIIRSILLENDPGELKKSWQEYRRHTDKNLSWILPELASKGARQLEDMRSIFDKDSGHGQTLENLKQLSFYTDSFSNSNWSLPKDVVDERLAKAILSIADILAKKDNSSMTTEKELELWVKHMKPVWKQEMAKMKQALINCYSEAETLGRVTEGKTKEMTEFVL